MKMLFLLLAGAGLVVYYLENKLKGPEIATLPISTPNYDLLLQQTLLPAVAAGQIINPDRTRPYVEADPTIPGGILVYPGT